MKRSWGILQYINNIWFWGFVLFFVLTVSVLYKSGAICCIIRSDIHYEIDQVTSVSSSGSILMPEPTYSYSLAAGGGIGVPE